MLLHLPHSGRAQRPATRVRSGLWASGRLGLEPKPLVGASALAFEGKLAIGAIEVGLQPGGWSCLRARVRQWSSTSLRAAAGRWASRTCKWWVRLVLIILGSPG